MNRRLVIIGAIIMGIFLTSTGCAKPAMDDITETDVNTSETITLDSTETTEVPGAVESSSAIPDDPSDKEEVTPPQVTPIKTPPAKEVIKNTPPPAKPEPVATVKPIESGVYCYEQGIVLNTAVTGSTSYFFDDKLLIITDNTGIYKYNLDSKANGTLKEIKKIPAKNPELVWRSDKKPVSMFIADQRDIIIYNHKNDQYKVFSIRDLPLPQQSYTSSGGTEPDAPSPPDTSKGAIIVYIIRPSFHNKFIVSADETKILFKAGWLNKSGQLLYNHMFIGDLDVDNLTISNLTQTDTSLSQAIGIHGNKVYYLSLVPYESLTENKKDARISSETSWYDIYEYNLNTNEARLVREYGYMNDDHDIILLNHGKFCLLNRIMYENSIAVSKFEIFRFSSGNAIGMPVAYNGYNYAVYSLLNSNFLGWDYYDYNNNNMYTIVFSYNSTGVTEVYNTEPTFLQKEQELYKDIFNYNRGHDNFEIFKPSGNNIKFIGFRNIY